ncbi:BglII/BstYI family type II restriction endonuclease [Aurantiacibacter sp. MUD61]|uniref:BglII/BstYI family type II restriction endonuclease n=1 Tax=Aurantiacibacter sp. MUD61 TaxID=3009083 RepID=UPI0022EFF8F0|nr:BglII/BstYI family type II restriction endonuclease [Aurantiacibacter sp. MUD61]
MDDENLQAALRPLQKIKVEDKIIENTLPDGFTDKYEFRSFRNAATLARSAHPVLFQELLDVLLPFEIEMRDILEGGGNKSRIAKKLEGLLHPLGWNETRISADLLVKKSAKVLNKKNSKSKFLTSQDQSVLENFLDGHQIDFVKGRVAFDLEWNSKDQTFDRDLYAMRMFYECGIIDVGIILTRSTNLSAMFADIGSRISTNADKKKSFKDKYGASTTWMGKLDYRVNAGRSGGCPILALGFREPIFTELKQWRAKNPVVDDSIKADDLFDEESDH